MSASSNLLSVGVMVQLLSERSGDCDTGKIRSIMLRADLKTASESKPCSTSEEGVLLLTHEHMSLARINIAIHDSQKRNLE